MSNGSLFVSICFSEEEAVKLRLLVDSIRTFGGPMAGTEFWVYGNGREMGCPPVYEDDRTRTLQLEIEGAPVSFPFAAKVAACARAEETAKDAFGTLIWIDPGCLVLSPPELFILDQNESAALRPVHIRNVGLFRDREPDKYWRGIFRSMGIPDLDGSVETFVEGSIIRPYYNTHAFSVRPAAGIMNDWEKHFMALVADVEFQQSACSDPLRRIFLHQAVFSSLVAGIRGGRGVRLLPPSYCYPYNLQDRVPAKRRAGLLNSLATIAYEERPLDPALVDDIRIEEPLRSWLARRT